MAIIINNIHNIISGIPLCAIISNSEARERNEHSMSAMYKQDSRTKTKPKFSVLCISDFSDFLTIYNVLVRAPRLAV